MKQHIEAINNEYKLLKCTICTNSFEQKSFFHQHKEYHHESNTPYKCELCPEGFDGDNNFNRHIELIPGAPYVIRPARPRSFLDFEKY